MTTVFVEQLLASLRSAKYDTGSKEDICSNSEQLSLLSQTFHLNLIFCINVYHSHRIH